jgi:hypothetical protein
MESFEHVVKIWLESKNYTVSAGRKFPVRMRTRRKDRKELQTHGYEVDLVASRADELLLVSVKSLFGSRGFSMERLAEESLFKSKAIRDSVHRLAGKMYGYKPEQVHLWLCVGNFKSGHETKILDYVAGIVVGGRPVRVVGLAEVAAGVVEAAKKRTYFDDPVIATLKALSADGRSLDRIGPAGKKLRGTEQDAR